jgi:hypothetical protein
MAEPIDETLLVIIGVVFGTGRPVLKRHILTDYLAVQNLARKFLGRDLTVAELQRIVTMTRQEP